MSIFSDEEAQEIKKRQIRENFERYRSIYK